jgi:hypothetical protein
METVTLSPDLQVTLPQSICAALKLEPGAELRVVRFGQHVELIPVRRMQEARGFLRGMDTTIVREDDRL